MVLVIGRYDLDDGTLEAAAASDAPVVRVYRPDRVMVVLGAGSRPERELNVQAVLEDGVRVVRRAGGGCAVVLDPGNVVVSVAYRAPGFGGNRLHFDAISAWLVEALARLGFEGVRTEGGSDLVIGDRKFAGACVHRGRDLLLYAASLLVAPRLDLLPRYLAHPPREPAYRGGRPHLEFVRPLADAVPGWTAERFEAVLRESVAGSALQPHS